VCVRDVLLLLLLFRRGERFKVDNFFGRKIKRTHTSAVRAYLVFVYNNNTHTHITRTGDKRDPVITRLAMF